MAARQPQFSPKQVADALQVSESSLKRWCDNGAIESVKTVGGHRRITLDALQAFLSHQQRQLSRPEVLGLPPLAPNRCVKLAGNASSTHAEFRAALANGDESTCRRIVRQLIASGMSRTNAADSLITDAMRSFGDAWQSNELAVYQERRGCDIALRLIYELRASLPALRDDAPVAIGGAPEGDPYQLPTAIVELALREIGWNATSLGNNLPIDSVIQAVADYQPDLVWLSVSSIPEPDLFVAAQSRLASALGEDVPLFVGGRALDDRLRPRLRYTAHCDSLRNLVDLASMMRLNLTPLRA